MKFNHVVKVAFFYLFVLVVSLNPLSSSAQGQNNKTVEDLYPGLASGTLKSAVLVKLPKGTLLTAGGLTIKESEISKEIRQSEPSVRRQLIKNFFYLLENMAIKRMLLQEASKAGYKMEDEDQAIMSLLYEKIKIAASSEEELKSFYNQNKEMIGNAPFEEIQGMLQEYLTQGKREKAVQHYILTLGKVTPIRMNEEWVKKQSVSALDNPVDRARRSGKPTMVQFGAPGCAPCDMMKPILANLKKKFAMKMNVLYVNVRQEQILGDRFGIQVIPVQVFFDKNGLEVFRHTGFFPQAEIERTLTQMKML